VRVKSSVYLSLLVLAGLLVACAPNSTIATAIAKERVATAAVATVPFDDFQALWFGQPAVWVPPTTATFDVHYFVVHGVTQPELTASLDGDDLCQVYHCLSDPGQPSNKSACALEGTEVGPSVVCYSPRTATFQFRQYLLLPQWTPAVGSVAIRLVEAWNALMHVLYVHEATHASIAVKDLQALTDQSHRLATCTEWAAFWSNPHLFDQLNADQSAYHATLRADCRPEIGCVPYGWMGWI